MLIGIGIWLGVFYLVGALLSAIVCLLYTKKVNELCWGNEWQQHWDRVDLEIVVMFFLSSWIGFFMISKELWRIS